MRAVLKRRMLNFAVRPHSLPHTNMSHIHQFPHRTEPMMFSSSQPDLFDFELDVDASSSKSLYPPLWDTSYPPPSPEVSASPASTCSPLELSSPPNSFDGHAFPTNDGIDYSYWVVDDLASTSAPVAIPNIDPFSKLNTYSPTLDTFPLAEQSYEPSYEYSVGGGAASQPAFMSLWQPQHESQPMLMYPPPPPPLAFDDQQTVRGRPHRASAPSVGTIFTSASAPSDFAGMSTASRSGTIRASVQTRGYSRRAERELASADDSTIGPVRRKRRTSDISDTPAPGSTSPPSGSQALGNNGTSHCSASPSLH